MANQSFSFPEVVTEWNPSMTYLPENIPSKKGYLHPLQGNYTNRFGDSPTANTMYRAMDTFDDTNLRRIASGYNISPEYSDVFRSPLSSIYETGAIRGSNAFKNQAYFNLGHPAFGYRSSATSASGRYNLANANESASYIDYILSGNKVSAKSTKGSYYFPEHKNIFIEASPSFVDRVNAQKNPLYSHVENAYAGDSYRILHPPTETLFIEPQNGKRGMRTERPIEGSFLDRINPANRSGLRITQTDPVNILGQDTNTPFLSDSLYVETGKGDPSKLGPEWQVSRTQNGTRVYRYRGDTSKGHFIVPDELQWANTTIEPPNAKVLYDRITPFKERTVPQHLRNVGFEAKVFLNQPEVKYATEVAKGAGKIGVNAAGLVGYAGAVYEKGPLAAVEWGIPFTPLKMGIGPINTLNAPEKAPYHLTEEYREEAKQRTANDVQRELEYRRSGAGADNPAFLRKQSQTLELPSMSDDLKKVLGL